MHPPPLVTDCENITFPHTPYADGNSSVDSLEKYHLLLVIESKVHSVVNYIYKFQTLDTDKLKTFRDIPLSEKTQKG